ncbi:MAG: hypothetical protein WBA23_13015 [Tunicatimonas sp.]|uniref:hypothetical protein n=1 Tax=Tunicatimonas sp. TaxID=1940096 RepID=UPI003C73721F
MKTYRSIKSLISILSVGILLSTVACDNDDEVTDFVLTEFSINGPDEVSPGDTTTFSTSKYEGETYAWTVPANGATIVSGAGTSTIAVAFTAAGSGDITVAARGISGTTTVTVVSAAPMATVTLPSDTVLTAGATSNVLINFDQPIETAPQVVVVPASGTSAGEAVSAVTRVDDRTFQVTYTAGNGDGVDKINVDNAVTTAGFGSLAMDTIATFDTYRTDNTSATGRLTASLTPVDSTTTSTLTVTFSEPLRTESAITVSVVGAAQNYVTDAEMTTTDGQVWTYAFQPEGGTTELATVSVSNLSTDLAGNATTVVDPITIQVKN